MKGPRFTRRGILFGILFIGLVFLSVGLLGGALQEQFRKLQASVQRDLSQKTVAFKQAMEAKEIWQREQRHLLLQRDELSDWVEQAGGRLKSMEEERNRLLDRMKALLKERNDSREEAGRLRADAARLNTSVVRATEETDRWKQEAARGKQEAAASEAPAPADLQKLQAAHRREVGEVRKDMEFVFAEERRQLTQQIQQKESENQRAKTQVETLNQQARQAEAHWKERIIEIQKETAQTKAELEKIKRADQEQIRKAQEQTRPLVQDLEKKQLELERLRSSLVQDWTRLYIRVGTLETAQGNYKEAEAAFRQAVTLTPSSGVAHYNLAVLYDNYLNDRAKAVQEYEQYLLLVPHAADTEAVKGWVHLLRGEEVSQRQRQDWTRPGVKGFDKTLKQIFQ